MSTIGHWVNGESRDSVFIQSRALNYGDGVFETIRVRDGNPEFFARHITRLKAGCQRLQINSVNWDKLVEECNLHLTGCEDAVLKVLLARGSSQRGYQYDATATTDRLISLFALNQNAGSTDNSGVRVRVCETRLGIQPLLAGIKHLNRLEQILARAEWTDSAIREGIMLDVNNQVIEGTMSNLFAVEDGVLYTPKLSLCGVSGVLRSVVLDVAKALKLETRVISLELSDLTNANEIFICNSLIGVCPVIEIQELKSYQVGAVTSQIQSAINYAETDIDDWYSE